MVTVVDYLSMICVSAIVSKNYKSYISACDSRNPLKTLKNVL